MLLDDIDLSKELGGTTAIMDYIDNNPDVVMQSTTIKLQHSIAVCSEITKDSLSSTLEYLNVMGIEIPAVYKGWKRIMLHKDEWLMVSPSDKLYFVTNHNPDPCIDLETIVKWWK